MTGLTTVAIEEALNTGVPVLVIDVKGDLPSLLLAFPDFDIFFPAVEPNATHWERGFRTARAGTLLLNERIAHGRLASGRVIAQA